MIATSATADHGVNFVWYSIEALSCGVDGKKGHAKSEVACRMRGVASIDLQVTGLYLVIFLLGSCEGPLTLAAKAVFTRQNGDHQKLPPWSTTRPNTV